MHDGDCVVFQSPEEAISIVVCTDAEYQELYADYTPGAVAEEVEEAACMDVNEMGDAGDISGYTGCWKLDNEPFYFVINEEYEWIAVNLYGEQVGPGYVVNEGENITLCMEDGTELVSLWQTAYGALSDANGNTLTASEPPGGSVTLRDFAEAIRVSPQGDFSGCAFGVIGGADGPVALAMGRDIACSQVRREKERRVTWTLMFREKRKECLQIMLLGEKEDKKQ